MNLRNKDFKSVVAMVTLTAIVGMSPLNVLATIEDEKNIDQIPTFGCSESLNKNDDQLAAVCKEIVKKWGGTKIHIFNNASTKYSVAKENFDVAITELGKSKIDAQVFQNYVNEINQLKEAHDKLCSEREIYRASISILKDFLPEYKKYCKDTMDESKKLKIIEHSNFSKYKYVALINLIEFQTERIQSIIKRLKNYNLKLDQITVIRKDLEQIETLFQSNEYCDLIQALKEEFNGCEFNQLKDISDTDFKTDLKMVEFILKWENLFQAVEQDISSCKLSEYSEQYKKVTNDSTLKKYKNKLELMITASKMDDILSDVLDGYGDAIKENELKIITKIEIFTNEIIELANYCPSADSEK